MMRDVDRESSAFFKKYHSLDIETKQIKLSVSVYTHIIILIIFLLPFENQAQKISHKEPKKAALYSSINCFIE